MLQYRETLSKQMSLVHSQLDYGNGALASVPAHLMYRLKSVLNASARLIFNLKRSDHISDALISLHWLRVPEYIQYKIAVLTYKVLCGTVKLSTVGSRAFPVAASQTWNSLPDDVTSASTLRSFQQRLKTHLFR